MSDLISRQDAIDAIERLILPQTKGGTAAEEINRVAWRCAINCAEELIGHLPSAQPQQICEYWDSESNFCTLHRPSAQPTIDAAEVVHGEWMEENHRTRSSIFYCSVCHRNCYDIQPTRIKGWVKRCRYAYCPNCGAKMDEVEND